MSNFARFVICAFSLILFSTVIRAQDQPSIDRPASASSVTAVSVGERVRFTAPANVLQMRVQIFAPDQQMIFDATKAGNVFDWTWLGKQDAPLAAVGAYTCVVTIKTLNGRTSRRLALMTVEEKQLKLQAIEAAQLTGAQRQTLGVDEGSGGLIVLGEQEAAALTAIGHDGTDGAVTSTTGALTFRTGDFFAGTEKEQMRITPDGKIGIGTQNPQATLDVAGTIRSTEGIEFADRTVLTSATGAAGRKNKDGTMAPFVAGTGTLNRVAKWLETGGSGTLGDSAIAETSGLTFFGQNASAQVAPLFPTASTFHVVEVGAPGSKTPLVLAGGSGSMEFWKDLGGGSGAPVAAAAFGMATPGVAATNDMVFSTYTQAAGSWSERMRVTTGGNVGIGTNNPASKLDVAGDINTSTQYNLGGLRVLSNAGNSNLFVGVGAGTNNTGNSNSFFGKDAGLNTTTAFENSFFGFAAGKSTMGGSNSFFGVNAGEHTTQGNYNTFIGATAGVTNTTGGANTFVGRSSGLNNDIGSDNVFLGYLTGDNNTGGNDNTFLGTQTGFHNTTGFSNTFVGVSVGNGNTTGSNNTLIGSDADVTVDGLSYATAIGAGATVSQNNRIVLGRTADSVRIPGDLIVVGNVSKGSGSFTIDHPLDPANKTLSHSFVESPDMMNIYNGNIKTNARGQAVVVLPAYFESLNRDFRYQLTVIGQFAQAIIATKIQGNRFVIKTSKPRVEVSWQVTGIRHDAYADLRRIKVEEDKPVPERGSYLHPDAFTHRNAQQSRAASSLSRRRGQR